MNLTLEMAIILGLTIVIMTALISYLVIENFSKKKRYYKSIIDNSTNIVIVSNSLNLIDANRTFFEYFNKYSTISEFSKEYACICDFFEEEEGYLSPLNEGVAWVEYLIKFQAIKHKVKMKIEDKIYYFLVSALLIDEKDSIYAMILSDITEQETTKHELVSLSVQDAMTNIGNRKLYEITLKDQIILAQRYVHPFSLLILDIDFFKKVNDNLGHDVGDKVLQEYTRFITIHLRQTDVFCRIGGEEFAVILPHTTKDKAYILAQKIRELVQNHKSVTPITISAGLVQYEKGDDEESIFKRADKALYRAKESGRNRVVLG